MYDREQSAVDSVTTFKNKLDPPDLSISLGLYNCRYGMILAPSTDNVIGRSLSLYGEWAEHELSVLRRYVVPETTVIDVGANIGTHTLAFSQWVRGGRVIAIEAQPVLSRVLKLNCANNKCFNVQVVNAVCGQEAGFVRFYMDYMKENNFGAVSFTAKKKHFLELLWLRRNRFRYATRVPVIPLDELFDGKPVSLIKIDVEGMELDVLRGARNLLASTRPAVFFEQTTAHRLVDTRLFLTRVGYRLFWLETHPFNLNNFRQTKENIWSRTETGIIALPKAITPAGSLTEVQDADAFPPHDLEPTKGIELV
jgi:FkbM family methyltransferase